MKKIILFLLSSIAIGLVGSSQTTYYVSSNSGNDNNNGTSPESSWQTTDKVNDQIFTPGDTVLFKRGNQWIDQRIEISGYSGAEGNVITFGAYPNNPAPNPVFTNIVNASGSWFEVTGNHWVLVNSPEDSPERLWVNGIELLRGNDFNEMDNVNFLWAYQDGSLMLYHEGDPSTSQVSFTSGNLDLYLEDASYFKFENLDFQGGWTTTFINCNVHDVQFDHMKMGKNATSGININCEGIIPSINNILITNCIFDSNFTLDYSMAEAYDGSDDRGCGDGIFMQAATNCEIQNNSFVNWGHASINLDGNPEGGDQVKVSFISVHDNYMTSPDICYGGRIGIDDTHDCEIFNNEIINTSVQSQLNGYNNHFHHNILFGTTNPPILDIAIEISAGLSIESYSNTEVYGNIIENNLFANTEGAGFRFTNSGYFDMHDNIIRNNIMYNCGKVAYESGIGISVQPDTDDCATYNNDFKNNLIFNDSTTNTIDFRGTISDVLSFNTLNGVSDYQINNNLDQNPLFTNPEDTVFLLSPNSPCINAGTVTLSTEDFIGTAIPVDGVPDIGIYEFFVLSIGENSTNKNFLFYPNPTNDFIDLSSFQGQVLEIMIYDERGKLVIHENSKERVDISGLENGLYLVEIRTEKGRVIGKVLKGNRQ